MINKEKYNKGIQEVIDALEKLKIKERYMREDNRVCCLGGVSLMLEDLVTETEHEMAIPTLEEESKWVSQKQLDCKV